MSRSKVLKRELYNSLEEVKESIDGEDVRAVIQLAPRNIHADSDTEILEDGIWNERGQLDSDIPVSIEVHIMESTEKPKKKKEDKESNATKWEKVEPNYSKQWPNCDEILMTRKNQLIDSLKGKDPVECFETFFNDEVFDLIVEQTMIYARQKGDENFMVSKTCIKNYIAMVFISGFNEDVWFFEDCCPLVQNCWPQERFKKIEKYFHLKDNSTLNGSDKFAKIRPLWDKLNASFQQFGVFSESLTIGGQIIETLGPNIYLPKPVRYEPVGFLQWVMCCAETGFCFKMDGHQGLEDGWNVQELVDFGPSVITEMVSDMETPAAHKIFFIDFFTDYPLMKTLKDMNIRATGAVDRDKMNECPIANGGKNQPVEFFDYRFELNDEILAIVTRKIRILTNYDFVEPTEPVIVGNGDKKVTIQQPRAVFNYKKSIDGLTKLEKVFEKCPSKMEAKRWYTALITNAIETAAANAHIAYCLANKPGMSIRKFKKTIIQKYLSLRSEFSWPASKREGECQYGCDID